jgi:hypothetical protein
MAVLRLSVNQWVRYHRQLGDRMHRAGLRGAKAAALRVIALMVERTRVAQPASDRGAPGAVNTGEFLRAWKWLTIPGGTRVLNDRPYGAVIEYGRRPGARPPPVEPIRQWLVRRVGMADAEAENVAELVARAIGIRGLRGRAILTGEDATAQIEVILESEIIRELERAIARPP